MEDGKRWAWSMEPFGRLRTGSLRNRLMPCIGDCHVEPFDKLRTGSDHCHVEPFGRLRTGSLRNRLMPCIGDCHVEPFDKLRTGSDHCHVEPFGRLRTGSLRNRLMPCIGDCHVEPIGRLSAGSVRNTFHVKPNTTYKAAFTQHTTYSLIKAFLLFLLVTTLTNHKSAAQCIDQLGINPTAPCSTDYTPVCGCDQKTYRNTCYAQYRNGVQTYVEGPCSGFEFDIFPLYVSQDNYFDLNVTFVQNAGIPAHFVIVDVFGNLVYERSLPAFTQYVDAYRFQLDVSGFRQGVYIAMLYNTKGTYRYIKFTKY